MLVSRLCGHCQVNRLSSANNYEATDFELYKELVEGECKFKDTSEVLPGLISDTEDSEVQ